MKEIDVFSLINCSETPEKSVLLFNKKPTKVKLIGSVLEKQLAFKDDYLIITSFDSMFGEYLSIYLLDKSLRVKDLVNVDFGHLSGVIVVLNDFKIISDNEISFTLESEKPYRLKVLNTPQRCTKLPPYFKRRWYKAFGLKYFDSSR